MPSDLALNCRNLCREYYDLMDNRSAYVNKLQGELRMAFPQYLGIFSKVTINTSLTLLETYTSPSAFQDACMMEHLRKLLQLNRLSERQTDILLNLSPLPLSGIFKVYFRKWMCLDNANKINHLIRYGFIMDDTEDKKIALHPLIQEIILLETLPSVSNCKTMLDSLHLICLAHGLDVRKPQSIINSLISICDHVINDIPEYHLLFLQDTFPYFDKYLVTDYLPKLVERMEYVMKEMDNLSVCDKAL